MSTSTPLAINTADNAGFPPAPPEAHQRAKTAMKATYSPDDNKLRLYSSERLDRATYDRVAELGFRYAPKQGLFVAPAWSPSREDLLIELCGEIADEDTSLVDRAAERAERFEDYSGKRAAEANAAHEDVHSIASRFEFGQPILVGHHSERKARKDAERMEAGMRRAVNLWETSTYWQDRAAGALAHAKYKELPAVRARRIKTIEAELRKAEREQQEAQKSFNFWSLEGITMEQALRVANVEHSSRCYPLAQFPRNPPASQYEGQMGLWSALTDGVITVETAREHRLQSLPRRIKHKQRWIDHYNNRIAYERAMLQEQGGVISDRFNIEVGGKVLVEGEWVSVLRINKTGDRINSVSTNRRYCRVVGIEKIKEYEPPSADQAAAAKAVTKVAPQTNYPGDGFIHITSAQWEAIGKDYRTTETKAATETTARHRVRKALGVFIPNLPTQENADSTQRANSRHSYYCVYLTDAKTVNPPSAAPAAQQAPKLDAPERDIFSKTARRTAEPKQDAAKFEELREKLGQGVAVQVVSAPQLFPTPKDLAERMARMANIQPGHRVLEPSAGTGRLLGALGARMFGHNPERGEVVAIELNSSLCNHLRQSFPLTRVHCADFLCIEGPQTFVGHVPAAIEIGSFDVIVMNPPFSHGEDIKHIQTAMRLLNKGGRLVALCANGPRQRDALMPLVQAHGGIWEDLPDGTFAEEGTMVRCSLICLDM